MESLNFRPVTDFGGLFSIKPPLKQCKQSAWVNNYKSEFCPIETAGHSMIWPNTDWQKIVSDYLLELGYQEFA